MKIDIVLYLEEKLDDGDIAFQGEYLPDLLYERLSSGADVDEIYYSIPDTYKGRLVEDKKSMVRRGPDDLRYWKELFSKTGSSHLIKIYLDSPFIDPIIVNEMIDLHTKYMAEFTFSENLPPGITCEIISSELVGAVPHTEEETLSLSRVVKSNLNQFDVELYYKSPDLRSKRISFRSGIDRDKRIMEGIYDLAGRIPEYSEIEEIISKNPQVLYIAPSYIEIELTGRCDLDCIFCYRNFVAEEHGEIELDIFKKILNDMKAFQLSYNICFGGSGEPVMHPKFYEIVGLAVEEGLVKNIIIETNGIYADSYYKDFIKKGKDSSVKTIININGMDNETYNALHGRDYFDRVFENIKQLVELNDDEQRVYIQVMKINETEPFLDRYYDFWEKYKIPIILQKQNRFLNLIEDRTYSDLSPIDRTPCWHLQRDMLILSNGSVGFCKQDIDSRFSSGNIKDRSIAEIWNDKKEASIKDYNRSLHKSPDCSICDEWYTFNL